MVLASARSSRAWARTLAPISRSTLELGLEAAGGGVDEARDLDGRPRCGRAGGAAPSAARTCCGRAVVRRAWAAEEAWALRSSALTRGRLLEERLVAPLGLGEVVAGRLQLGRAAGHGQADRRPARRPGACRRRRWSPCPGSTWSRGLQIGRAGPDSIGSARRRRRAVERQEAPGGSRRAWRPPRHRRPARARAAVQVVRRDLARVDPVGQVARDVADAAEHLAQPPATCWSVWATERLVGVVGPGGARSSRMTTPAHTCSSCTSWMVCRRLARRRWPSRSARLASADPARRSATPRPGEHAQDDQRRDEDRRPAWFPPSCSSASNCLPLLARGRRSAAPRHRQPTCPGWQALAAPL